MNERKKIMILKRFYLTLKGIPLCLKKHHKVIYDDEEEEKFYRAIKNTCPYIIGCLEKEEYKPLLNKWELMEEFMLLVMKQQSEYEDYCELKDIKKRACLYDN